MATRPHSAKADHRINVPAVIALRGRMLMVDGQNNASIEPLEAIVPGGPTAASICG
jgi:hypothetical protein